MALSRQYPVSVENVGDFTFHRRTMKLDLRIEQVRLRITGGEAEAPWIRTMSTVLATLEVLTISAPDGWNLDDLDPLDDDAVDAVLKAYRRLREAEETFRAARQKDG